MLSFVVSGHMGVPVTQSAVLGAALCLKESMTISHLTQLVRCGYVNGGHKIIEPEHDHDHNYKNENENENRQDTRTVAPPPPPLYLWVGLSLCCAIAYALYNISIKKGSNSIHPIIGGVILQFVGAIFGLILLGIIMLTEDVGGGGGGGEATSSSGSGSSSSVLNNYDSSGIRWSCLAGLAVGFAELLSFGISGMGVQATQSIHILIGGSVVLGAVLGIFILGETIDLVLISASV